MALIMNALVKLKHFRLRSNLIIVSEAIRNLFTVNQNFQANNTVPVRKESSFGIMRKVSTPNRWLEGMSLAALPAYIFWPAENRYGKVLWWGYGNTGLFFIEKGRGYVYAGTKEVFHPASEPDYLDYMQKIVNSHCLF